jgi:hypothetical protein
MSLAGWSTFLQPRSDRHKRESRRSYSMQHERMVRASTRGRSVSWPMLRGNTSTSECIQRHFRVHVQFANRGSDRSGRLPLRFRRERAHRDCGRAEKITPAQHLGDRRPRAITAAASAFFTTNEGAAIEARSQRPLQSASLCALCASVVRFPRMITHALGEQTFFRKGTASAAEVCP